MGCPIQNGTLETLVRSMNELFFVSEQSIIFYLRLYYKVSSKKNVSTPVHFKYSADFKPAVASCTVQIHFKYNADFKPAVASCTVEIHFKYRACFKPAVQYSSVHD